MGNKWRKLRYNLIEAARQGKKRIVTMGGAYSNHIAATAAACKECGISCVGIIRGNELSPESNETLKNASLDGMNLCFVDRMEYRSIRKHPAALRKEYPDHYFLPEGGTNALAIKGCREIVPEIDRDFDWIGCAVGTGGTFCGIIDSLADGQQAIGISALKGAFMEDEVNHLTRQYGIGDAAWRISLDYHFGGYAKTTDELIDFINWFKRTFHIPLDPIYTGKAFFGVWHLIDSGFFASGARIILLHTGGLQGIDGFNRKNRQIIQ